MTKFCAPPVKDVDACPVILVVDDNALNRDALHRRLEREHYQVVEAVDGEQALNYMRANPVDLILLDIMMPVLDGTQVLRAMKADSRLSDIPVVMVTAVDNVKTAADCISLGADDFITKPFNPALLRARVTSSLSRKFQLDEERLLSARRHENNEQLQKVVAQQAEDLDSAQMVTIFAMSKLAESRDPETGAHLERMREYCRALAEKLSQTDRYAGEIDEIFVHNIYAASALHDIGKVGVPDKVLLKPGPLDDQEWITMKTHTTIGADTLRAVDVQYPGSGFVKTGIEIAEFHHERWDGTGYPHGLKGLAIPLSARIMCLGDVYDALTSRRCYKKAFTHEQSLEIIVKESGKHFEPAVVEAFVAIESEFVRIRSEFQDP